MPSRVIQPGWYWVNSFRKIESTGLVTWPFTEWRDIHHDVVKFHKVVPHLTESPPYEWILFELTKPTTWTERTASGAGLPTKAPKGAWTDESDTFSAPQPETPSGTFADQFSGWLETAGEVGGLFLLWALYEATKGRR